MDYPRVIIIGETFRLDGGGGITLTNLFKDWPANNIGVITDLIIHTNTSTKYSYYQLGCEEIKFPFPFNLMQTYFKSGPYTFDSVNGLDIKVEVEKGIVPKLKKKIRPYFDNILSRLGLFSFFYTVRLSESLKKWILDFRPDIIYIQPFQHRMMQFGNQLHEKLRIPYAIHIMDDSVTYINKSFFMNSFLQRRIEMDFSSLIYNAKVHLCISEAMAEEYFLRYGKVFSPFRNPVEINHWRSEVKDDRTTNREKLRIIYTGRIFPPTIDSLIDVCKVVDRLNRQNKNISLEYTLDNSSSFLRKIRNLKGISYHPQVDLKDFPRMIQQYDIFLICINFDRDAQKYFQFSMSTRASEGMITGVPILVYAPVNFAVSRYFEKTDSGCIVGERDTVKLETAILKLWNDQAYRDRISRNAVNTALEDSDSLIVRDEFRKALTL